MRKIKRNSDTKSAGCFSLLTATIVLAWQKTWRVIIRPLNKTQGTRLPVSEGAVEDATQVVADAPAYVLGSSPTAAGEITGILDRGVYPMDDDQIHESRAVLDHNDESGMGSNTGD